MPGGDDTLVVLLSARMVTVIVFWVEDWGVEQPAKTASRRPNNKVRKISFSKDRNLPLESSISAQVLPV
jgi:hypothetical protein